MGQILLKNLERERKTQNWSRLWAAETLLAGRGLQSAMDVKWKQQLVFSRTERICEGHTFFFFVRRSWEVDVPPLCFPIRDQQQHWFVWITPPKAHPQKSTLVLVTGLLQAPQCVFSNLLHCCNFSLSSSPTRLDVSNTPVQASRSRMTGHSVDERSGKRWFSRCWWEIVVVKERNRFTLCWCKVEFCGAGWNDVLVTFPELR